MVDLKQIPVRDVRGVGSQKAELLRNLGIETVSELIEYFPFRYEDYRLRDLSEVQDGDKATVQGRIYSVPRVQMFGRAKSRMVCKVVTGRFIVTAVWFNRHFMRERLQPGSDMIITGKWDAKRMQITVSESEFPGGKGEKQSGKLQPVYSVNADVPQKWLRRIIHSALDQYGKSIVEILPEELLEKHKLPARPEAIRAVHDAGGSEPGAAARRRMAYEELLLLQLKLQALRILSRKRSGGIAHVVDRGLIRAFVNDLPFALTHSQQKVTAEILRDMEQPYAMNRLLQGDVGSGKTIVAAIALYAAVKAGCQGALMVPTEILAEQHGRFLSSLFQPYGVQTSVLTGSVTERQRRDLLGALQLGLVDIVIGTHALIQDDVHYRRLGIVITDEQHRFGVLQRAVLRRKGLNPDVLTMTATPIPRTLAITAYGDMDVSTLRELPAGRKPIKTYWVKHDMLPRIIAFMDKEMNSGKQCYVICPLIEESEKLDVQNAVELHTQLVHAFPGYPIGLLHGRMGAGEKEQVMRAFAAGELGVLVSTTVIEVGIDVPNASVMVIYDAERFGLSQLHQLRGRVGRGEHQSYCILIADPKSEVGIERMNVMTETNDGFEVARRDLELRGPGDFFGTKQSGAPVLRFADIVADFELVESARDDAAQLVSRSDFWTAARYLPLRGYLQQEKVVGDMLD